MAPLAYIYDGFYVGSTQIKVRCYDEDGLNILLYLGYEYLGTEVLSNSEAIFNLSSPITQVKESFIAYVGEVGSRTGGCQIIATSNIDVTGWKTPSIVEVDGEEMSYQEYLDEGNRELPDVYDGITLKNRTPDIDTVREFAKKNIGFSVDIESTYGQTVVSVISVTDSLGGYSIQFDDDAISNDSSKIYTESGDIQIKVIDNADSTRISIKNYTITVIPSVPPVDTEIEQIFCTLYYNNGSNGTIGIAIGNCPHQLQFKVDGVMGSEWQDSTDDGNNKWYFNAFVNLTSGIKTFSARVKTNPSDVKTQTFKVI